MPCPIVKASSGGTCPGTASSIIESNSLLIEGTEQHQSQEQRIKEATEEEDHKEDCLGEGQHHGGAGDHHQQQHPHPPEPVQHGDKAVLTACNDRMPCSIVRASPGGTCPGAASLIIDSNIKLIEDKESQQKDEPSDKEEGAEEGGRQHHPQGADEVPEGTAEKSTGILLGGPLVKGASEEENRRYQSFLEHMEMRRKEAKARMEADEERKEDAKKKAERWALLRRCLEYLAANEEGWRTRRLEEVERVKEEEKRDRLAVVRLKKMRYGIGRLNKEEASRMKSRSEERILLARGRENLWKKFQGPRKPTSMKEEDIETWECLQKTIGELEEDEDDRGWHNDEYKIKEIRIRKIRPFGVLKEPVKEDESLEPNGGGEREKSQAGGKEDKIKINVELASHGRVRGGKGGTDEEVRTVPESGGGDDLTPDDEEGAPGVTGATEGHRVVEPHDGGGEEGPKSTLGWEGEEKELAGGKDESEPDQNVPEIMDEESKRVTHPLPTVMGVSTLGREKGHGGHGAEGVVEQGDGVHGHVRDDGAHGYLVNKRRHSGRFTCKTNYNINGETSTVRQLVGKFEEWGRGDYNPLLHKPQSNTIFKFGESPEIQESPLKRRRLAGTTPSPSSHQNSSTPRVGGACSSQRTAYSPSTRPPRCTTTPRRWPGARGRPARGPAPAPSAKLPSGQYSSQPCAVRLSPSPPTCSVSEGVGTGTGRRTPPSTRRGSSTPCHSLGSTLKRGSTSSPEPTSPELKPVSCQNLASTKPCDSPDIVPVHLDHQGVHGSRHPGEGLPDSELKAMQTLLFRRRTDKLQPSSSSATRCSTSSTPGQQAAASPSSSSSSRIREKHKLRERIIDTSKKFEFENSKFRKLRKL